jgi:flagellin
MPVISTNVNAINALQNVNQNSATEGTYLAQLASGSRINKASDDAAGLAIGAQLSSNVAVLAQASTNASQGTSILQVADGGLSVIGNIITRLQVLAAEAASGNVSNTQRSQDINTEFQTLVTEVDNIASGTRYAGNSVLNSSSSFTTNVSFIVGVSISDQVSVSIAAVGSTQLSLNSLSVTTQNGASSAVSVLTSALNSVTKERAQVGAFESQFNFVTADIATNTTNTQAATSTILDADVASAKSSLSSADVKYQASIAALAQAAKLPQELLSLLQS